MSGAGLVAVVTDSTAYLDEATVRRFGLAVVPLEVVIAGRAGREGADVSSDEVAGALRVWAPVSTSRPSPHAFGEVYAAALDAGAHAVVSVHLSAELSGTVDSARTAAAEIAASGRRVEVVDSRSLAMGLGFPVLSAARAAADGGDVDAVARAARRCAERTRGFFYVDTLEHLRRGGRIGAARALLGQALAVKPLLAVVDGRIVPLEKVRTASRALVRLEEVAVSAAHRLAGDGEVDVAVQHLASPDRAVDLAGRLAGRLPGAGEVSVGEVGAVVGAHVGPGMIAVVVSAR